MNFKGDSGKTTTVAHLAQYLALTEHRVLAFDIDITGEKLDGDNPKGCGVELVADAVQFDIADFYPA